MANDPKLSPASNFENEWSKQSENGETAPDLGYAIYQCLKHPESISEAVKIIDIQFSRTQPAHLDDLTVHAGQDQQLIDIKFLLFFARLTWTYDYLHREYRACVRSPEHPVPELSRFLPLPQSRYERYKDWFAEYAFAAFYVAVKTEIDRLPNQLAATLAEFKNMPAIEALLKDSGTLAAKNIRYKIDHRFISSILEANAKADRIGARHINKAFTSGKEGIVVQVKGQNDQQDRVLKMPKPVDEQPYHNVVRLMNEGRRMMKVSALSVAKVHSINGPEFPEKRQDDATQLALIRQFLYDEGSIYIEMDFYSEGSLQSLVKDRVAKERPSAEAMKTAAGYGWQIASTLASLHEKGISHGDLKFDNCLLSEGKVVLTDFGLSREFMNSRFGEGYMAGTPLFRAPELWEFQKTTAASDTWALGVMLYRLWSGHYPFDDPDLEQKIKAGKPERPTVFNPSIPEALAEILSGCLIKDAERRLQPHEVAMRLANWLEEQGSSDLLTKFAWNPELVKPLLDHEFVFLLIKLSAFGPNAYERITSILSEHNCTIFRIYRTLGRYDVVVRTFISNSELDRLIFDVNDTAKEARPIVEIIPHKVSRIRSHWHWTHQQLKSPIDPAALAQIDRRLKLNDWYKHESMKKAISDGIIRAVTEKDHVIFFIFISETKTIQNRGAIVEIIEHTLESTNRKAQLFHCSIYEVASGPTLAIVKAEVLDYFVIGDIVQQLGEKLAASGCTTLTCMAADRTVRGREDLPTAQLTMRATTKMLQTQLPTLYASWLAQQDLIDEETLKKIELTVCAQIIKHGQRYFTQSQDFIAELLTKRLLNQPLLDTVFRRLGQIAEIARKLSRELKLDDRIVSVQSLEAIARKLKTGLDKSDVTYLESLASSFSELDTIRQSLDRRCLTQEPMVATSESVERSPTEPNAPSQTLPSPEPSVPLSDDAIVAAILNLDGKVWHLQGFREISFKRQDRQ